MQPQESWVGRFKTLSTSGCQPGRRGAEGRVRSLARSAHVRGVTTQTSGCAGATPCPWQAPSRQLEMQATTSVDEDEVAAVPSRPLTERWATRMIMSMT